MNKPTTRVLICQYINLTKANLYCKAYFFSIKVVTAILFLLTTKCSIAQSSTANYTTSFSATASMHPMTNSIKVIDINQDDVSSVVIKIGFDFWFMGKCYSQLSMNSNGAIRLGNIPISSTEYIGAGSTTPFPQANRAIIAPFLANLATSGSGQVHYELSGVAPNRKFTVEFMNMKIKNTSASPSGTFQVSLNETSGVINFDYFTTFTVGTQATFDAVVGFNSEAFAYTVKTINHVSPFTESNIASPTIVNYATASAVIGLQNKRITFTPVAAPSTTGVLNTSAITATSMNLSWTDVAGEQAYAIYGSTDNVNFNFYAQTAANATNVNLVSLIPNKLYYWRLYACSEGQLNNITFISKSATTLAVGAITTNTATISTEGIEIFPKPFTYNWTNLAWSNGIPNASQNVEIILDIPVSTKHELIEIYFDLPNICVNNLSIRNINASAVYQKIINTQGLASITVLGDVVIKSQGGNKYNRTNLGNLGATTIFGKTYLGSLSPTTTEGHAAIGSAALLSFNQRVNMYDDFYVYPRGYTTEEWTIFSFLKPGTQYLYNETLITDTVQPVMFQNLYVGNGAASTNLIFAGTAKDAYIRNVSSAGFSIFANSILDLPKTYSLTKPTGGGTATFDMAAGAKIRLGGFSSISRTGVDIGLAGSNFPNNFSFGTGSFSNTSTFEYYGDNSATQIIHNPAAFNYKNLLLNNNGGVATGRAQKITNVPLRSNLGITIQNATDLTIGDVVSCYGGVFNIQTNGGLYCGINTVLAGGTFTMNPNSYLGIGHDGGITALGTAYGNIQMTGGRNYSTTGNYIYYGNVAQVTGTGLPSTSINELTIDNPTTVTNSQNVLANGTVNIKQGLFDIGTTKLTSATVGTITSTGGKLKANIGTIELKGTSGTAQYLSGSWFIGRNISTLINANTVGFNNSATVGDSLLISSALLYGAGISNSQILTRDNITLLSRDSATARFGEIVASSGNSIVGNVTVERYIPATRKWRLLAWPTTSTQTAQQSLMENATIPNANPNPGYGCIVTDEDDTRWTAGNFDSKSVSGPSVKYYDPATNKFIGIPNTRTFLMNSHSAYYNYVRGNRSSLPLPVTNSTTILRSTGTLKTGNQTFNIPAGKFDAIGNPYASPIDIRKLDTTGITGDIYVWDPKLTGVYGLGAYQVLYKSGSNYLVMPGGGSYSSLNSLVDTLESGQGFYVRARASGATITVKEDAKTIGARTFTRGAGTAQAEVVFALLNIVDPGVNTLVDGAMAAFDNSYSSNVDFDDALKLTNTSENVSFKRSNTLLAIERRSDVMVDDTLHLNMKGLRIKKYQWDVNIANMTNPGRTALLVDRFTNTTTNLSLEGVTNIQFDVTSTVASYAANRFMIVFKQIPMPTTQFTTISAIRNANKTIKVNYAVANETNIASYTIEQSNNGTTFTAIGTQAPVANNSGNPAYSFNDNNASLNNNWYRVKFTSTAGVVSYSAIAMESATPADVIIAGETKMSVYPNPVVGGNVNVHLDNQAKGTYTATVTNKMGQTIKTANIQVNTNTILQTIKIGNAATGSYQVAIVDELGNKTVIPFIVK
jgi:hypothetical protein